MIKKIAWDAFKKTGNIDTFMEYNQIENIENTHYDEKRGLWIWDETEVLVKSNSADCPIRGTKKADIETGEDKKGE